MLVNRNFLTWLLIGWQLAVRKSLLMSMDFNMDLSRWYWSQMWWFITDARAHHSFVCLMACCILSTHNRNSSWLIVNENLWNAIFNEFPRIWSEPITIRSSLEFGSGQVINSQDINKIDLRYSDLYWKRISTTCHVPLLRIATICKYTINHQND